MAAETGRMTEYYLVDVFAAQPGQGNPAAVVPQADGLTDAARQAIAARLAVSETAFLSHDEGLRLRWFTPRCEVQMCGHATLATAQVLGREEPVEFITAAGPLAVRPEVIGGDVVWWLAREAPAVHAFAGDPTPLLAALGDPPLDDELPLALTADGDLLVPLASWPEVEQLTPDFARVAAACEAAGVRGLCPLAVPGPGICETRVRFFAPHLGVPEDPVTGSVHGAIVVYLHELQVFEHFPEELRALSHQGDPRGRQGQVWLRLRLDPETDRPLVAEVGGQAVSAGKGRA